MKGNGDVVNKDQLLFIISLSYLYDILPAILGLNSLYSADIQTTEESWHLIYPQLPSKDQQNNQHDTPIDNKDDTLCIVAKRMLYRVPVTLATWATYASETKWRQLSTITRNYYISTAAVKEIISTLVTDYIESVAIVCLWIVALLTFHWRLSVPA